MPPLSDILLSIAYNICERACPVAAQLEGDAATRIDNCFLLCVCFLFLFFLLFA